MMAAHTKRNSELKIFVILLFMLYMAALLKILLFRDNTLPSSEWRKSKHAVNLIPLQTVAEYTVMAVQGGKSGFEKFFSNIIGNILIMVPFGYFLPVLWSKFNKAIRVTMSAAVFSVIIELLQYLWNVGSSDVDDVILNTLGGLIGYLIYQWISHREPLKRRGYLIVICLSVVMLSGGVFVAVKEYSSLLGIGSSQTQMVQKTNTVRIDQPASRVSDPGYPVEIKFR